MATAEYPWERALGAVPGGDGTVEFRVWAPHPERVDVRVGGADHALRPRATASAARASQAKAGDDYVFVLDGRELPDPASRWQPEGLRGPSRVVDPRDFAWTDGGRPAPAASRDAVLYELHVGTFTREGTFDGRDRAPARAGRARRHRASRSCRSPSSRARRGWGYDGVYLCAAQSTYGGPHGLRSGSSTPPTPPASASSSTSSTTTSAPPGNAALRGLRPLLHREVRDVLGQGDQLRRRGLRPRPRVGRCRAPRAGSATSTSTACASTRSTRSTTRARDAPPRASSPTASTRRDHRRARHRRVRPQRPEGHPPARRRAAGAATPQWADDFHHALRVLLTGDRDGYYEEFGARRAARQGVPPPVRARRRLLAVPPPPLRRAGRRPPGRAVRRLRPEPRPGRQPRARRPAARPRSGRSPRSARCCRPFTPDAVHGRGVRRARRRSSSSPTTSTRRSPTPPARAAGASSPPSPRSPARRCPTRRTPRRSSAPSSRARATPALRDALPRACSSARRELPAAPTPTRSTATRTGRWLRVRRGPSTLAANFAGDARVGARRRGARGRPRHPRRRAPARRRGVDLPAARRSARAMSRRRRDPRGLARPPVPARRDLGRRRARTSRCSPSTPSASSCACSTTTATRSASSSSSAPRYNWHCYLPGVGPGPALRLPRPRPVRPARRATASTRPSC